MAALTPAEYEYATTLEIDKLPNKLRCAVCNHAVVDAMKTECCDTVMCGPCAAKLTGTCPVCEYTGSPTEMTREDKRTRTTLKAHIKGELQKLNNAAALAAKEAEAKLEAEKPTPQPETVETPVVEEEPVQAVVEPTPAVEDGVPEDLQETAEDDAGEEDGNDDKSDIEIITERPELEHQQSFQDSFEGQETNDESQADNTEQQQYGQDQQNMNFDPQSFMNFAAMNGLNPMMAMQSGMMPFGMMPNMMGMPPMGMDPSMMFNGGFGGMNGMMNGSMMMPGMGDMNDFNPYNSQQYGNRFDNRFSHPSNRGSGRGYGGQDFRGRGRGSYRGRGRGGWQQQNHYHNGQQEYNQQGYQGDYDSSYADNSMNETQQDHIMHEQDVEQPPDSGAAVDLVQQEQADDNVAYDHRQDNNDTYDTDRRPSQAMTAVPIPVPPVNAPTGPRAMREGLPNSGRYSRPQTIASEARPVSRDQSAAFKPPTGPSADRHKDDRDDSESTRPRHRSASRSRSADRSKRHRSRSGRRDDKYDDNKYRRRDRKREREYDDERDHGSKKRSRSTTPDDAHRRHRHRDDRDRSRRDRSRDKHRDSHRSRDKEQNDYDDRRKSKSYKSSRRDREDKYGDDFESSEPKRPNRAVLEEPQDDIGFKIKGTKSGQNAAPTAPAAPARGDPYAEERERMRAQRLQRDAERRQGTNGKRSREDSNGDDYGGYKKKRSKGRGSYDDQNGEHEHDHDRHRWR